MNAVMLAGAATREPELRYTPNGKAVLDLHLAGRTGRVWYQRVTAFGKLAEGIANTRVGAFVGVAARLDHQTWEKDGERRHALKLIANRVTTGDIVQDVQVDAKGQPIYNEAVNHAMIAGNLTADPVIRNPDPGKVANFTVAINERVGDQDKTHFVDASAWRDLADRLEHASKGTRAIVAGRVLVDSWEAKDGSRRFKTKLDATEVLLDAPLATPAAEGGAGDGQLDIDDEFPPEEDLPF